MSVTATVLSYSSDETWKIEQDYVVDLHEKESLPSKCYIFLDKLSYEKLGDGRKQFLDQFDVPRSLSRRTYTEFNGYFGSRASYREDGRVKSCSTWFRCLVKMVRKIPNKPHEDGPEYVPLAGKDYVWFEMGFFTCWDSQDQVRVVCVDTPPDLPSNLQTALEKQAPVEFKDPFSLHRYLIDQMIILYDISVWRVRDPVRIIEKHRKYVIKTFKDLHDMARHGIHVSEVLAVSIQTLEAMQRSQAAIHKILELDKPYCDRTDEYTDFQIRTLKSLNLRSESNNKRISNEIALSFNSIAHSDNAAMKSVTILTMFFLPATFCASLFSTSFFSFGGDDGWKASGSFWLYWAVSIPSTLLVVVLYYYFSLEQIMGVLARLFDARGKLPQPLKRSPDDNSAV